MIGLGATDIARALVHRRVVSVNKKQIARFWSRVSVSDRFSCWEWRCARDSKGYGMTTMCGFHRVHRLAYESFNGPIPAGLIVRHKCDNPPCCNPDHLELGTQLDNVADRVARGRNGSAKRSANGRAKLTEEQVAFIRANRGKLLQRELGAMFGVAQAVVSMIQLNKTWR